MHTVHRLIITVALGLTIPIQWVFAQPPVSIPAQRCSPGAVTAVEALQDSCNDTGASVERKKVALAHSLFPDSPFLESLMNDVWPYDWEGMVCKQLNLTPAPGNELLVLLYVAGMERSVSLTIVERDSSGSWNRYDLIGTEIGIQNTLFLLGDEELLDRLADLSIADSNAPFPWARDLDGDGLCEVIVHDTTTGYVSEDRSGPLYWPEVYAWRNGEFLNVSEEFPQLYESTVLPLYAGILDDLQADWEDAGKLGVQPTVEKVERFQKLFDNSKTPSDDKTQ